MQLDFKYLFELQAGLDDHIKRTKGLQGQDLLDKKILSLLVELGELANEWRGFKFWSENQKSNEWKLVEYKDDNGDFHTYSENPLLEEYVDGLHFFLSIGIDLNVAGELDINDISVNLTVNSSIESMFIEIFNVLSNGWLEEYDWFEAIESYLGIGFLLGFTADQVMQAYLAKNEVNHNRQLNSY